MTYLQKAITSIPTAIYMLDERGTTIVKDQSGFGYHATMNTSFASANVPILAGASNAMLVSLNNEISYPPVDIWSKYRDAQSFSIEFWIMTDSTNDNYTIFQPYEAAGPLNENYIKVIDSSIVFSVSENSSARSNGSQHIVKLDIDDLYMVHHVVCVYTNNSISITLDGGKKTSSKVFDNISFSHTVESFKTVGGSDPMLISGLAIYRKSMSINEILSHYQYGQLTKPREDIIRRKAGDIIPINTDNFLSGLTLDFPRVNSFTDWTFSNAIVSDSTISLRKYPNASFSGGTPNYTSALFLGTNQYVYYSNVENVLKTSGGIAGYWTFNSVIHSAASEFTLSELVSGDGNVIMGVYKNAAGRIVFRYKYLDTSTGNYVVGNESNLAAASVYYGLDTYIYYTYTLGEVRVYINNSTPLATINTSSFPQFNASTNTSLYIGSNSGGTNTWRGMVHHVKLFDRLSDISNFISEKSTTSYGIFCLPLVSSLAVAQEGSAEYEVDMSWLNSIAQSYIDFGPHTTNIKLYSTVTGSVARLLDAGKPIPDITNNFDATGKTITLRIELSTLDSWMDNPVMDYLSLWLYTFADIRSKTCNDQLSPVGSWWVAGKDDNILVYRKNNGLVLEQGGGAELIPDSTYASRTIRTVEFWLYQPFTAAAGTYFDTIIGSTHYKLEHNGTNNVATNLTVYINGNAMGAQFSFQAGKWYHVVLVAGSNIVPSGSNHMMFGMNTSSTGYSLATFKNIAFYPTAFTATEALENYNLYIGNDSNRVIDRIGKWYKSMPKLPHVFGEQPFNSISDTPPVALSLPWTIISG